MSNWKLITYIGVLAKVDFPTLDKYISKDLYITKNEIYTALHTVCSLLQKEIYLATINF